MRRLAQMAALSAATAALAGCGLLPASGPVGSSFTTQAATVMAEPQPKVEFALVDIGPTVLDVLSNAKFTGFADRFTDRRPAPTLTIGIGDVVAISIFEASAGGLFIPGEAGARAGNFIQLPSQEVDRRGNISIPYAGIIPAAGRTVQQVQELIQQRLRNRAIEPQAVVNVTDRRSTQVTVLGDVSAPQKLILNPMGERILDVIARAGGTRYPGYEMKVTLERNSKRATVRFSQLVSEPQDNIFVVPGDTIYLARQAPTFVAFGASTQNAQMFFDKENLSLSEAVGKIGGLSDLRADPDSVMIYRIEDRSILESLHVDLSQFGNLARIPVVYRAKLRDPNGMFLASSFQMQDRDLIYIANSFSVDYLKFLQFINANINFATNAATLPSLATGNTNTVTLRSSNLGGGTVSTGLSSGGL